MTTGPPGMSLDPASLNIPGTAVQGQVGKEFPDTEHLRRERAYKEQGAEIMKVLQKQWAGESRRFCSWVSGQFVQTQDKENSCWRVALSGWLGRYRVSGRVGVFT